MSTPAEGRGGDGARAADARGASAATCLGREKRPKSSKRIDFGGLHGLSRTRGFDYPDGVYAELLEGYRSQDVVNETLPDLRAFLEAKGAWEVYLAAMTQVQGDKAFWGHSNSKAEANLAKHAPAFQDKGILPYFCTDRVGVGSDLKCFKWIVYVDKDAAPEGYRPPRVHGDHKCTIV